MSHIIGLEVEVLFSVRQQYYWFLKSSPPWFGMACTLSPPLMLLHRLPSHLQIPCLPYLTNVSIVLYYVVVLTKGIFNNPLRSDAI